ncbi:hypothetical protein BS50DRAFT_311916 [Corynespora cassiicola Philippines]|uniref:Uncharacterized protein n=1 Tax=Corynespora cassiicola Philippines TaxID=1448308 RepID=A0A2T2NYA0_CORCC|nr:hypothetical protein BS50DRAFT_311916 [Corynespora cassiicola Philippines]
MGLAQQFCLLSNTCSQRRQRITRDMACMPIVSSDFVSRFLSVLPRELRDNVYSYCIEGEVDNEIVIDRNSDEASTTAFVFLSRTLTESRSLGWAEKSVLDFMDPTQSNPQLSSEIAEAFYRSKIFKFTHDKLDLVEVFLTTDIFGHGTTSAASVRFMELQIQPYANLRLPIDVEPKERERCRRGINSLALMQSRSGTVTFSIDLAHNNFNRCTAECYGLRYAVNLISSTVGTLKTCGMRTTLSVTDRWDQQVSLRIIDSPQTPIEEYFTYVRHLPVPARIDMETGTINPVLPESLFGA